MPKKTKPRAMIGKVPVWCAHDKIVPCVELKPNPKNPNTHPASQIELLGKIIREQGWRALITISNRSGLIVKGHARLEAAFKTGIQKAPVEYQDYESEAVEHADMVADNRIAELAVMDEELLAGLLSGLNDLDFDMELTGFSQEEIDMMLPGGGGGKGLTDDDDVPEVPGVPTSKTGDLYLLGEHRLLCGDATRKEDAARLMKGQKADMVFTSPPYWVGFEYENEKDKSGILKHIDMAAYAMATISSKRIIINTASIASVMKAKKITGKKQVAIMLDWWVDALNRNNFLLRHIRIWSKCGGVTPSRNIDKIDFNWEYLANLTSENETAGFVMTFYDALKKCEQNKNTPVWAVKSIWADIPGKARSDGHVAAFPVELARRNLFMYTERGEIVCDTYSGSGSTLIACEKTDRRCYGMEIDPHYCDVIVKRWEDFTGNTAELIRE